MKSFFSDWDEFYLMMEIGRFSNMKDLEVHWKELVEQAYAELIL